MLYVGTSRDIRPRVRTYFTASEQRTRMAEMVGIAESVTPVVCHTTLEAEVRELRLIAEHKPRYNRRSRHPERALWVKLTVEAFPRLSIVREVRDDGTRYVGPFSSRLAAESAIAALHEVVPLRQCTKKLSVRGRSADCALAEMGRCGAPCTGAQSVEDYAAVVAEAAAVLGGDAREVVSALHERMGLLAGQERFEDAGAVRDRMLHLVRAAARAQRLAPLAASPEVVAARRSADGGWEVVCVRYGRLAGTTISPRGADPMPYIAALTASAEVVAPGAGPLPAAHARGDREGAALARGAGRADRRARGRVDLPGARRRRRAGQARAPGRRPARRGRLRRTRPGDRFGGPSPRRSSAGAAPYLVAMTAAG